MVTDVHGTHPITSITSPIHTRLDTIKSNESALREIDPYEPGGDEDRSFS